MTTLKDISLLAGVPVSTVSYVLNRKGKAVKEKHRRILEIAKELNYVPNQKAVSLVSGRANNIGLVIAVNPQLTYSEPFFSELLLRMSSRLSQENMGLTLYNGYGRDVQSLYQYVLSGSTDGFIWYQSVVPEEIKQAAKQRNIPIVVILDKDEDVNYLAIDDYSGQMKALRHLYDLQHRKILFLTAGDSSVRRKAYLDFVERHGLEYRRILDVSLPEDSAYKAVDRYLTQYGRDFTAIAAEIDVKAIGAMQAMVKWNISVPEEVSIIGYDDIPMASSMNPPLTTVQHSLVQLVDDSINILFDCLDNGVTRLIHKTYEHHLVVRHTTGPCRQ
ncbi:LacI family DNA-binding transcriptional regulator [Cohnella sp. REN36]|uniref:LacI family DNA-binding transcriptional regulator n=1 Tax=Cohnella sp. REN36 TaxID=2887347 RepID=UPI001D1362F8|nr:LacI family DNA-binding transcriptional regulator [Cohnella sp. REN36]MCC3372384.1 LacI family transcriptional regulator [Cohnella sp. REN36]